MIVACAIGSIALSSVSLAAPRLAAWRRTRKLARP